MMKVVKFYRKFVARMEISAQIVSIIQMKNMTQFDPKAKTMVPMLVPSRGATANRSYGQPWFVQLIYLIVYFLN